MTPRKGRILKRRTMGPPVRRGGGGKCCPKCGDCNKIEGNGSQGGVKKCKCNGCGWTGPCYTLTGTSINVAASNSRPYTNRKK